MIQVYLIKRYMRKRKRNGAARVSLGFALGRFNRLAL